MEFVDMFDNKRKSLNKKLERYTHVEGEYAQGSHVWIMNSKGELLIQKRTPTKRLYPNLWSITSGGTDSGETTLDTAYREVKEELGIELKPEELELVMSYKRNHDFVDVWLARKDIKLEEITMQKEEVAEVKWVTEEELENLIKEEKTPKSLQTYFGFLKSLIN
jgi:8-oxo-dGTP pyrophosphatase MutT (NUDIX family)